MSSPSQDLANRIILKLVEEKLIQADDKETMTVKLSQGKLRQDDWRLAVEKSFDTEEQS